jgi:transposase
MSIIGGLDIHRSQVTFDVLDTVTGEAWHGQVRPADREHVRAWLAGFVGRGGDLAMEGCTGWRYVAEETAAAGLVPHMADPAELAGQRGRKRHAKTDRADARFTRDQLQAGRLPECCRDGGRPAGQAKAVVALQVAAVLEERLKELWGRLVSASRHLTGARELQARLYGGGPVTALALACWLGGQGRFSSSRKAVRFTGLDVTVYSSVGKRSPGTCHGRARMGCSRCRSRTGAGARRCPRRCCWGC